MGLDGGTIPTRGELVRMKEKPEQKDKDSDREHKWRNCALTQQPLQEPVLTCQLGMLYNKKPILELIIGKIKPEREFNHIRSLRDVKQLTLKQRSDSKNQLAQYICPITGLDMNGKIKFVVLWGCACVISDKAIRQIPSKVCLNCSKPFTKQEIVSLNPDEATRDTMKEGIDHRRSIPIQENLLYDNDTSIDAAGQPGVSHISNQPVKDADADGEPPSCSVVKIEPKESKSCDNSLSYPPSDRKKRKSSEVYFNEDGDLVSKRLKFSKKDKKSKKNKKHKKSKKSHKSDRDSSKVHPGWKDILKRR